MTDHVSEVADLYRRSARLYAQAIQEQQPARKQQLRDEAHVVRLQAERLRGLIQDDWRLMRAERRGCYRWLIPRHQYTVDLGDGNWGCAVCKKTIHVEVVPFATEGSR